MNKSELIAGMAAKSGLFQKDCEAALGAALEDPGLQVSYVQTR